MWLDLVLTSSLISRRSTHSAALLHCSVGRVCFAAAAFSLDFAHCHLVSPDAADVHIHSGIHHTTVIAEPVLHSRLARSELC
jgi:hypothetical protein